MNIKRQPDKLSDYDSACANGARLNWMPYFSLLSEGGNWTRFCKRVFSKSWENEKYQNKINNIWNVVSQTQIVSKRVHWCLSNESRISRSMKVSKLPYINKGSTAL
jgi:hypothetical protein